MAKDLKEHRQRRRQLRGFVRLAVGVSVCLTVVGCLGPTAVSLTRTRYNEVYRSTNDEQQLLNIVRLRYADSPIFIDLPNITSQFEMTGRGSYSYGLNGEGPGMNNLGLGEIFVRDAPTLSYHPRSGKEIATALLSPLSADLISVVNAGANIEQFLLMAVNDINDVQNAGRSIAMTPSAPDDNYEFRRGVQLLSALMQRGAAELTVRRVEDTDTISDPIPVDRIKGGDLVTATKENFVFRKEAGDRMTVRKQEKSLVVRIRDQDKNAPDVEELCRIFRVKPGKTLYKIKSELSGEHPERVEGVPDELDLGDGETLFVNMRSMLQIAVFLSKGVCIPQEHVTKGIAPMTVDGAGQVYDWTNLTDGLFRVHADRRRPKHSETAVKYRGYWFYIAPDDVQSRAVMAVYEILFAVQESEGRTSGPILTLPLGG